jgi:hypothetical protein
MCDNTDGAPPTSHGQLLDAAGVATLQRAGMKRLVSDILFLLGLLSLAVVAVQMVRNEAANHGNTAGPVVSRADPLQTTSPATAPQTALIASQPVTQDIVIRTDPAAHVWIDGQLRHMSPVFAALPKGHHRIAVGRLKPELMRELDIHSQQAEPLTLNFELAH